MNYFSMFSGIGGFEYGIQRACIENEKKETERSGDKKRQNSECSDERADGFTCIGYSEVDKYAIQIYERHFNHRNFGDATKIISRELPDFDLLVAGFPCQAFSIAGKRGGFDDTRGTLFFEIARVLKDKRPRYFLLENVKGLLSHEQGKTFQTILGVLTDLGYGVGWQVLNSKNFKVPQNRERVFIIGHLGGTSRPKVFPIQYTERKSDEGSERETSGCINAGEGHTQNSNTFIIEQLNQPKHSNDRVYSEKGISPSLNTAQGGNRQPFIASRPHGFNNGGKRKHPNVRENGIRRLTPTECERLQGFPDGWTEGVSDTQKYKCLGNAVTTNVIQAIMERFMEEA